MITGIATLYSWIRCNWKPSYWLLHGSSFGLWGFFTGYRSPASGRARLLRAGLQKKVFAPINLLCWLMARRDYAGSDFIMVFRMSKNGD